jgi:hypothetical protein
VRGNVVRTETGHARSRELDRERETVDATTDLHAGALRVFGLERSTSPRAGALAKQLQRRLGGEWCKAKGRLTLDPKRLSARGENAKPREARRQCIEEVGDCR